MALATHRIAIHDEQVNLSIGYDDVTQVISTVTLVNLTQLEATVHLDHPISNRSVTVKAQGGTFVISPAVGGGSSIRLLSDFTFFSLGIRAD